jgi:hypothetical protein
MIPVSLFFQLHAYFHDEDDSYYDSIRSALDKKMESMMKHYLYSLSKNAETEAEPEAARKEYLDLVGVPEDFRY